MCYKAENVDTDKALKAIEYYRHGQQQASMLRTEKERSFLEGVNKGLDIAQEIFECSNYEKDEKLTYVDGALEFIYELGKELDIPTQDLRDDFSSVDESCAELAQRIHEKYIDSEITKQAFREGEEDGEINKKKAWKYRWKETCSLQS